ncbi:hypothetical protein [Nocardioides sp. B-3]|uniref:hypothetical protein n=1 Tax=Nocardioides sp. B-3 TaxID=2895565 RepID=UPI00220EC1E6|nr:hypothetical protein LP418_11025 [Nocardioides sp. B-3]
MLTATENSVNTAFIDMTLGMEDGPEKIIAAANDLGIPPAGATREDHRHPHVLARPRTRHRRLARQRDGQPDQHGQRLRHHRVRR